MKDLPVIDAVVLSHDHYDHADAFSIRGIRDRFPDAQWFVPLGMQKLLHRLRVPVVHELDWWSTGTVADLSVTSVPAQHFSGRTFRRNRSLWCGFVLTAGNRRVYFVGDTGWFSEIAETGRRCGPFDAILMPIGAYDPRWFMKPIHMNPKEAVDAFATLINVQTQIKPCYMIANHWGTFKLTPEPLEEPPPRVKSAWAARGLSASQLVVLAHGETWWLPWRFGDEER